MNQFLFKINNRNSICCFLKFICDIFFIIHFSLIRLDFTSIDEKLSRDIDKKEIRWLFFFLFSKIHQILLFIISWNLSLMIFFFLIHFPLISMIRFYINFEKLSRRRDIAFSFFENLSDGPVNYYLLLYYYLLILFIIS